MSFCAAFQATAATHGDAIALRTPGGVQELTWAEYAAQVQRLAGGLAALGVRRGDTVALMLTNRPEFNLLDTAAMHLGAIPWSIYNTSSPAQIRDLVGRAASRVLITEERFATAASVAVQGLPVDHVIDVGVLGALPAAPADFDFAASWQAVDDDDVLTIIFTSGTTGAPKGVELTHGGMRSTLEALTEVTGVGEGGRVTSYLPAAHIADRWSAHYWPMLLGAATTCVADGAQIIAALPDVRPTIWGSVPRVWEKLRAALEARGVTVPAEMPEEARAALRAQLGLDQVELLVVGAAPLATETLAYFDALGLPLCEVWGMSETCGLLTVNPPGRQRIGTVGLPLRDVELRLAGAPTEDGEAGAPLVGEILARAPQLMRGYRGERTLTADTIDADGWLHTGDVGRLDTDGFLTIVDRKKELIINAAGKNMSPLAIEAALKTAGSLIGQACAIGDRRPFVTAVLVLDPEADAPEDEDELLAAVQAEVDTANARLSRVEHVRRWSLLRDEWLPDGDELTPTMKLKRAPIAAKYAAVIEELYA
jgi:long-subunit acyl-CoA synthetase (AMP-forming)